MKKKISINLISVIILVVAMMAGIILHASNSMKSSVIRKTELQARNYMAGGDEVDPDDVEQIPSTWDDLSSNKGRYQISGAIWNEQNTGLVFDGIDDYVKLGKYSNTTFTNEVTFEVNKLDGTQNVLSDINNGGFAILVRNGQIRTLISRGTNQVTVLYYNGVTINTKYTVQVVRDAEDRSVKMYVNGQLADSQEDVSMKVGNNEMMLGAKPLGDDPETNYFSGTIYAVRMYNRVLTTEELNTNYTNTQSVYADNIEGQASDDITGYADDSVIQLDGRKYERTKVGDLSLRTFVTRINDLDVEESREPVSSIENNRFIYKHRKDEVSIFKGDKISLKIRVYNEGQFDETVDKVRVYLPDFLRLSINTNDGYESDNEKYLWQYEDDSHTTITSTYLSNDPRVDKWGNVVEKDNTIYKYEDELHYQEMNLDLEVTREPDGDMERSTIIAEMVEETFKDYDSTPNNLENITLEYLNNYKVGECENTDENSYVTGVEDDDDFESFIVVKELDAKFEINKIGMSSDKNIEGGKIKITKLTPGRSILEVYDKVTGNKVTRDNEGKFTMPEDGVVISLTPMVARETVQLLIEEVAAPTGYRQVLKNLTLSITMGDDGNPVGQITSVVEKAYDENGNETVKTVDGSVDKVATLMGEDENGIARATAEGNNLSVKYKVGEDGEWQDYTGEFYVGKNCQIYSKSYDDKHSSSIVIHSVTNIDKILPEAVIESAGSWESNNQELQNITATLSDSESVDYGASGIFGYKVTDTEVEPTDWDAGKKTQNETVRLRGIVHGGTYYLWVKDVAGNVNHIEFTIADRPRIYVAEIVKYDNKPELVGTQYETLREAIEAVDPNDVAEIKILTHILNEANTIDSNKDITIDTNSYEINSKNERDLHTENDTTGKPTLHVTDTSKLTLLDRNNTRTQAEKNPDTIRGSVISEKEQGVVVDEDAELTLGINDNVVGYTEPHIRGVDYGVVNKGTLNFYDGIVIGQTAVKTNSVPNTPDDYIVSIGEESDTLQNATVRIVTDVEARIGRKTFTLLEDAIEAAGTVYNPDPDEQTEITIVRDLYKEKTVLVDQTKNIKLDLNGHSFTSSVDGAVLENYGKLDIYDSKKLNGNFEYLLMSNSTSTKTRQEWNNINIPEESVYLIELTGVNLNNDIDVMVDNEVVYNMKNANIPSTKTTFAIYTNSLAPGTHKIEIVINNQTYNLKSLFNNGSVKITNKSGGGRVFCSNGIGIYNRNIINTQSDLTNLVDLGYNYYFDFEGNVLKPTNEGLNYTNAKSYFVIDLTRKSKNEYYNVSADLDYCLLKSTESYNSQYGDFYYVALSTNSNVTASIPALSNVLYMDKEVAGDGADGYVEGNKHIETGLLRGGSKYYLHLCYNKSGIDNSKAKFEMSNIKLNKYNDRTKGSLTIIDGVYEDYFSTSSNQTAAIVNEGDLVVLDGRFRGSEHGSGIWGTNFGEITVQNATFESIGNGIRNGYDSSKKYNFRYPGYVTINDATFLGSNGTRAINSLSVADDDRGETIVTVNKANLGHTGITFDAGKLNANGSNNIVLDDITVATSANGTFSFSNALVSDFNHELPYVSFVFSNSKAKFIDGNYTGVSFGANTSAEVKIENGNFATKTFSILSNAKVTIDDGTFTSSTCTVNSANLKVNNGTFTNKSFTIQNTGKIEVINGSFVNTGWTFNNGVARISNGDFSITTSGLSTISVISNSDIKIDNGTFTGRQFTIGQSSKSGGGVNGGVVEVNDGTFLRNAFYAYVGTVRLNGGTYKSQETTGHSSIFLTGYYYKTYESDSYNYQDYKAANFEINGGTYDVEILANIRNDNFKMTGGTVTSSSPDYAIIALGGNTYRYSSYRTYTWYTTNNIYLNGGKITAQGDILRSISRYKYNTIEVNGGEFISEAKEGIYQYAVSQDLDTLTYTMTGGILKSFDKGLDIQMKTTKLEVLGGTIESEESIPVVFEDGHVLSSNYMIIGNKNVEETDEVVQDSPVIKANKSNTAIKLDEYRIKWYDGTIYGHPETILDTSIEEIEEDCEVITEYPDNQYKKIYIQHNNDQTIPVVEVIESDNQELVGTQYTSLNKAFKAVGDNKTTLKLLREISIGATQTVETDQEITIENEDLHRVYAYKDNSFHNKGKLTMKSTEKEGDKKHGWVLENEDLYGPRDGENTWEQHLLEQQWAWYDENGIRKEYGFDDLEDLYGETRKYFFVHGIAQWGWLHKDGEHYFFSPIDDDNNKWVNCGAMADGTWVINRKEYIFDEDGKCTNYDNAPDATEEGIAGGIIYEGEIEDEPSYIREEDLEIDKQYISNYAKFLTNEGEIKFDKGFRLDTYHIKEGEVAITNSSSHKLITEAGSVTFTKGKGVFIDNYGNMVSSGKYYGDAEKEWVYDRTLSRYVSTKKNLLLINNEGVLVGNNDKFKGSARFIENKDDATMDMTETYFSCEVSDNNMIVNKSSKNNVLTDCKFEVLRSGYYDENGVRHIVQYTNELDEPESIDETDFFFVNLGGKLLVDGVDHDYSGLAGRWRSNNGEFKMQDIENNGLTFIKIYVAGTDVDIEDSYIDLHNRFDIRGESDVVINNSTLRNDDQSLNISQGENGNVASITGNTCISITGATLTVKNESMIKARGYAIDGDSNATIIIGENDNNVSAENPIIRSEADTAIHVERSTLKFFDGYIEADSEDYIVKGTINVIPTDYNTKVVETEYHHFRMYLSNSELFKLYAIKDNVEMNEEKRHNLNYYDYVQSFRTVEELQDALEELDTSKVYRLDTLEIVYVTDEESSLVFKEGLNIYWNLNRNIIRFANSEAIKNNGNLTITNYARQTDLYDEDHDNQYVSPTEQTRGHGRLYEDTETTFITNTGTLNIEYTNVEIIGHNMDKIVNTGTMSYEKSHIYSSSGFNNLKNNGTSMTMNASEFTNLYISNNNSAYMKVDNTRVELLKASLSDGENNFANGLLNTSSDVVDVNESTFNGCMIGNNSTGTINLNGCTYEHAAVGNSSTGTININEKTHNENEEEEEEEEVIQLHYVTASNGTINVNEKVTFLEIYPFEGTSYSDNKDILATDSGHIVFNKDVTTIFTFTLNDDSNAPIYAKDSSTIDFNGNVNTQKALARGSAKINYNGAASTIEFLRTIENGEQYVKNGTITRIESYGSKVTVDDGTITSLYAGAGTTRVNGGSVTGIAHAVGGTLTINQNEGKTTTTNDICMDGAVTVKVLDGSVKAIYPASNSSVKNYNVQIMGGTIGKENALDKAAISISNTAVSNSNYTLDSSYYGYGSCTIGSNDDVIKDNIKIYGFINSGAYSTLNYYDGTIESTLEMGVKGFVSNIATNKMMVTNPKTSTTYTVSLTEEADLFEIDDAIKKNYTEVYNALLGTNKTVKLLDNIIVVNPITIESGKNATLDLNGKKIYSCAKSGVGAIQNNGTLKITDSTENPTGTISGYVPSKLIYNNQNANLNIENIKFVGKRYTDYAGYNYNGVFTAIYNNSKNDITINNITSSSTGDINASYYSKYYTEFIYNNAAASNTNSKITINNSNITVTSTNSNLSYSVTKTSKLYNADSTNYLTDNTTLKLNNVISGVIKNANTVELVDSNISGVENVTKKLSMDNSTSYRVYNIEELKMDNNSELTSTNYDSTYYKSYAINKATLKDSKAYYIDINNLQEVTNMEVTKRLDIGADTDGLTIKTLTTQGLYTYGKNITLNIINGYKIDTVYLRDENSSMVIANGKFRNITNYGNLIINYADLNYDSGTVSYGLELRDKSDTTVEDITIDGRYSYGIYLYGYNSNYPAKLHIKGGNIAATTTGLYANYYSDVTVGVQGNGVTTTNPVIGGANYGIQIEGTTNTVRFYDGVFTGNNMPINGNINDIETNYKIIISSDGRQATLKKNAETTNVAMINGIGYQSLDLAMSQLSSAENQDVTDFEVNLLADVQATGSYVVPTGKNVVFNMRANKITYNGSSPIFIVNGTMQIIDSLDEEDQSIVITPAKIENQGGPAITINGGHLMVGEDDIENVITPRIIGKNGTGVNPDGTVYGAINLVSGRVTLYQGSIEDVATGKVFKVTSTYKGWTNTVSASNAIGLKERIALAENEVGETVKKIVKYLSVPVVTHTPTEWTNQDVLVNIKTTGRLILNIADQEPGMDLALREYITKVNNDDVAFSRAPVVDADLVQGVLDRQNGNYKQIKKYLHTYKDDVITERINVFNEGTVSGYASEIIKYIPDGLEYISDNQTNIENGWEIVSIDGSGRVTAIKTNKLSDTIVSATDDTNTLLSLLKQDITLDNVPSVDVALKVTKEIENPDNVRESATMRTEITAARDADGNKYGEYFIEGDFTADDQVNSDLDSTPGSIVDPQLDTYYSRFAGATDTRPAYFAGEEDDDDAESIMVGEPDTDPASLTVNYIDMNEEEDSPRRLIDKKEVNSLVGVRYNEEPREFDGYQLIEEDDQGNSLMPTNASGTLDLDPVVINYYYKKVITITTKYEDEAGTTLKESDSQTKLEGEDYTTSAATIDNYVLIKDEQNQPIIPENANGVAKATIGEDDTINRNIVVTYVYIKVSNGVIERHVDIKSNKLIEPEKLHEGTVGTPYKIEPKEFYGYTLVETEGEGDEAVSKLPDNAEGIMTDEAITVTYYYLSDATVRVKYVDENGANISEDGDVIIEGYEGKAYETEEKTFAEYTIVTVPDNAEGNMTVTRNDAGAITSRETVVTYVYRLSDSGGVIVNHIDVINNVILQKEEISGHIREAYNTYSKYITGYSYITQRQITIVDEDGNETTEIQNLAPINASGSMLKDTIVVNYYYIPTIYLTVKYVDVLTNEEILSSAYYSAQEGTKMEILPRDIDGYVIADDSQGGMITFTSTRDEDGFITKDENDNLVGNQMEVVFFYNQVSNGVVEKHINIETDELLYTERHYGNVGDPYKIEPRDFENMVLVEAITGDDDEVISVLPENAEGVMTDELIEVKYYYRRGAKVRIRYQDIETGEFISQDDIIAGAENDHYVTHYKPIENYRLVEEPENAEGTMTVTMNDDGTYNYETVVIYKYRSTYSAGLKVNYKDIVTNELIVEDGAENPEIISGVDKRDEHYFIDPLEFRGYVLVEEDEDGNSLLPENQEGTFAVEQQEITFWYVRLASVKVSYLDRETNEELIETEVIDGHENDKYITSAKDIDGYVLVEKPLKDVGTMLVEKNADGTFDTETEVTYYYSKVSGGVIEKHIDIKTDAIMYNETHTGNVGDVYYIRDRAFTGYDVITTDEYTGEPMTPNATGIMKEEVTEVKYYYIRKTQAIAEYRDIDTKERIFTDEVIDGHEGDHYSTTVETFDGYTLENVIGNSEGTMAVTVNDDDTINVVTKVVYEYKADEVPEPDPEPENNETVENNTIINEVVNNTTIENEIVENEIVNNTVIENETIENEVVENEVVNNTTVENETIENEIVENNTVINEITNTTIENETVENEVVNNTTVENEVTNETTNTIIEDPTDDEDEDEDDPTKSDGVIEKYVDINTDEVIEIVRHKGKIGDPYEITPKEIEGYDLVTTDKNGKTIMPTNTKGIMTKDAIEVVYYCVMKAYVRVEYYNKNSGKKFIDDVVIEGHEGDEYEIEEKEFDGYELVEKTDNYRGVFTVIDNKDGTFNKEIVVRFYYAKINEEVLPDTGEDFAKNMAYVLAFIANVTLAVVAFVKFRGTKKD